jgi:hypothetical protein
VGDDRLRLVGDLVRRAGGRLAADGERARSVRVQAERAGLRVAVDDLDLRGIDPETIGDDLREAGLVALAVR